MNTSQKYVQQLDTIGIKDIPRVGGKNASLREIIILI